MQIKLEIPKTVVLRNLPTDMRVLIAQLYEDVFDEFPENTWTLKALIKVVSLDSLRVSPGGLGNGRDARDYRTYVKLVSSNPPPLLLWRQYVYDGRHRISAAKAVGIRSLPAIDLADIGLPKPSTHIKPIGILLP